MNVLVTAINNPFDRVDGRTIKPVDFLPGMTIEDAAGTLMPQTIKREHLCIVYNGRVCPDTSLPVLPGDSVSIVPHVDGDNIGRILGTIVVIAASYWIAGPAGTLAGNLGIEAEFGVLAFQAAASAAVMVGGMLMVNALFPYPIPKPPKEEERDQSYGWGVPKTQWQPGLPITVLYGKTMIAGQVINYYMETGEGEVDQIMYSLMAMCFGEVETPAASGADVLVNNSFRLDTISANDYEIQTTAGTTDQSALSHWSKLHQFNFQNTELSLSQVLLIHFDEMDSYSAICFLDSSHRRHTSAYSGAVTKNTSVKNFGTSSADFDGIGSTSNLRGLRVHGDEGGDFYFCKSQFTISMWIYIDNYPASRDLLVGAYQDSDDYWQLCIKTPTAGNYCFELISAYDGSANINFETNYFDSSSLPTSTWHHLELVRTPSDRFEIYLNGTLAGSQGEEFAGWKDSGRMSNISYGDIIIGHSPNLAGGACFDGKIDEFQVLRGEALHTADFTPPTSAYETQDGVVITGRGKADELRIHLECPQGLYQINTTTGALLDYDLDFVVEYKEQSSSTWIKHRVELGFVSGSEEPSEGDEIEGNTTGATGYYVYSNITGGTWAGGNAEGTMVLEKVTGTFDYRVLSASETLKNNDTVNADIATLLTLELLNGHRITNDTNAVVRTEIILDDLTEGKYDVRVRRMMPPDVKQTFQSGIFCVGVDEILDYTLKYPYLSLLGVKIKATKRLSGSAVDLAAVWDRGIITIPNFTDTGTTTKESSNPAWAAFDALTNELYSAGIDPNNIDSTSWNEWADWCDNTVDGNARITLNGAIMTQNSNVGNALDMICQIGRAKILQVGRTIRVVVEKPGTAVQMFSVGNIIGEFERDFVDKSMLPDALQVEYLNKDKNYTKDFVTVFRYGYDSLTNPKPPQKIALWGCTSEDEARRFGILRMQITWGCLRTVTFQADIDAIACQIGDIIKVQHDSNSLTFGGRIDANSTSTTIKLKEIVHLPTSDFSGNCKLWIRQHDDTIVERTISGPFDQDTDYVTISSAVGDIQEDDVYIIGRGTGDTHEYRVTTIERDVDSIFTITALEYNEDVYYHSSYDSGNTAI